MNRRIPDQEFKERISKLQQLMKAAGFDALLAHSTESDQANVRYLSDFWPAFESAGVLVPREGEPTLLVGPESEEFAQDRSRIRRVRRLLEYRESADPEYPGLKVSTFPEVFGELGITVDRLGIAGYSLMPLPLYQSLQRALPDATIEKADHLLLSLRMVKSNNELGLLRESFRIAELAVGELLEKIRPGMTELEVVGLAQEALYRNGAEYEGHALYVFSGKGTRHAISRPTHKVIQPGEMIQLGIGARVGGYSSSVGRPVCIGKMPAEMRKMVEAGLEAHKETIALMKAGVSAASVVKGFEDFVEARGYKDALLYGPCHGIGIMEVEPPWMEANSEYLLKAGMTFQADTFLRNAEYGLRWEDGVVVTDSGVELLSSKFWEVLEI